MLCSIPFQFSQKHTFRSKQACVLFGEGSFCHFPEVVRNPGETWRSSGAWEILKGRGFYKHSTPIGASTTKLAGQRMGRVAVSNTL
jgi:hypothetical protein